MLDIGWAEMGVIALVTLVVMGPKELPNALRTFAYWVKKVRGMAREFQSGVDQLIREADLDEAKKKLQSASSLNINREIQKAIDPERDLDKALALPPEPKQVTATAAEANPTELTPAGDDAAPALPPTAEVALPTSAEVKPFPVPGVPLTGSASTVGASSLRPNGNAAAEPAAAKPVAATVNGGKESEEAPSRKAHSG
jgi:sec-independent protein translocase protein TatB